MVDVGDKDGDGPARGGARRRAHGARDRRARCARGDAPKGDVVGTARIAGIQAAKRTAELIPLCHPLPLSFVDVRIEVGDDRVEIEAEARTSGQTGVEMEAMTAASVAALTVYDMVKGIERGVEIAEVVLLEKTGGRQDWRRDRELARRGAHHLDARSPRGEGDDVSGPALARLCEGAGLEVRHEVGARTTARRSRPR